MFYTYAHYTPQGRLFYIGKGQGERAFSFYKRGSHWNNVVLKYGKPEAQILAHWKSEKEALDHEVLLIDCFRSMGHKLCNKTNGGEGTSGYRHTDEQRENNRQARLGKPTWNKGIACREDTKKRISISKLGKAGLPMSEEAKLKISLSNKGRKHSEETKRKCGAKNIGRVHTEEEKQKRATKLIGNKYAVGNTNRLKYKIIGTHIQTGEQIEFLGAKAVNAAGFQHSNVIKCIYGKRKSHKGYTWSKEILENK